MPYTYEYPRPALTVDCVIFGMDESESLKVLLIQRAVEPFKNRWALPGGFVDMKEDPGGCCSSGVGRGNRGERCFHRTTLYLWRP